MKIVLFLMTLSFLTSCGFTEHVEQRARVLNTLEDKVLVLSKEKKSLQAEIVKLRYQVKSLESKNFYLETQLQSKNDSKARALASIKRNDPNDLVKFDVYKWKPEEMVKIAEKEFDLKNYEKSAQFFHSFIKNFPSSKNLNDKFLFQAGVAAYEAGKYYGWSERYFSMVIENHPTSDFFLGSKLWLAMTYLKQNKEDKFFAVAEEFRKKYRNTTEWNDILSKHYEKIVQKYKSN